MARRNTAPSVYIIGHKRYILEKRNLLCEFSIHDPKMIIDLHSKTARLYYPNGKEFVFEVVSDLTGTGTRSIISKKEAQLVLDQHPEGIKEKVYVRYFGEPEKV